MREREGKGALVPFNSFEHLPYRDRRKSPLLFVILEACTCTRTRTRTRTARSYGVPCACVATSNLSYGFGLCARFLLAQQFHDGAFLIMHFVYLLWF